MTSFTYPLLVRDRILDFIKMQPFFSSPTNNFTFGTIKSTQIQPEQVPWAAVYFIEDTELPSGDANVGDIRFRVTARYGISVIIQNNDAVAAEVILDMAMNVIQSIFKNPDLYNWDGG